MKNAGTTSENFVACFFLLIFVLAMFGLAAESGTQAGMNDEVVYRDGGQ